MASYKSAALYPLITELLRDGYQAKDIIKRVEADLGIQERATYRAMAHVRAELAKERTEDRQITFNLLKAGYERDLSEVDSVCTIRNKFGEETQGQLPLDTRIELRRKIRQSIADLYGFGKINMPSITINIGALIPDQRTAALMQRIDGAIEAAYTVDGESAGNAPAAIVDSLGGR